MGQKVFISYKDQILSFPLVEKHMGILKSGRYSGFDTMSSVNNLIIRVNHLSTIKKTVENGTQVENFGSYITPTGTIIHQDGTID